MLIEPWKIEDLEIRQEYTGLTDLPDESEMAMYAESMLNAWWKIGEKFGEFEVFLRRVLHWHFRELKDLRYITFSYDRTIGVTCGLYKQNAKGTGHEVLTSPIKVTWSQLAEIFRNYSIASKLENSIYVD